MKTQLTILGKSPELIRHMRNKVTASCELIFTQISNNFKLNHRIITFTLIALFSSTANSQTDDNHSGFVDISLAATDGYDRKLMSINLALPGKNSSYPLLRFAGITQDGTPHTKDATGFYLGVGSATKGDVYTFIEFGFDIIDFLDRKEVFCDTDPCEYYHQDVFIKGGFKARVDKHLLIGITAERISITNAGPTNSHYHNLLGVSLGFAF